MKCGLYTMGERLLQQLNCVKATSAILDLALGSLGHEVGVCVYFHGTEATDEGFKDPRLLRE
jgi:hypothetical protein